MKEQVTKFDFNTAFKALDEIEIPKVSTKPRRKVNFNESCKRVDRLSMLIEDYYDVGNQGELEQASEDRNAEVAQAKLARIEKIVDLDADSPEDLLPSYAGKIIIQCPQCMQMFYKDEADIEKSEEDESIVNVNEVCQHCGNDSGYTIIGKVAPVEENEMNQFDSSEVSDEGTGEEENELDLNFDEEQPVEEEPTEEVEESEVEESEVEEEPVEEEEEEVKEESFVKPTGSSLMEQVEDALNESADEDLSKKLKAHNEYIEYLQQEIDKATEELNNAKNDFIKSDIQRKIDALEDALNNAIPDEVKADVSGDDLPTPEEVEADTEQVKESLNEEQYTGNICSVKLGNDVVFTGYEKECQDFIKRSQKDKAARTQGGFKLVKCGAACKEDKHLKEKVCPVCGDDVDEPCEDCKKYSSISLLQFKEECDKKLKLNEESDKVLDDSDAAIKKMLNNKEFKTPISDSEVRACFEDLDEEPEIDKLFVEELHEDSINGHLTDFLTEVYENVESFKATNCILEGKKFIVEGNINFKSGRVKETCFDFNLVSNNNRHQIFEGRNVDLAEDSKITLACVLESGNKYLFTESVKYSYKINNTLVEGLK